MVYMTSRAVTAAISFHQDLQAAFQELDATNPMTWYLGGILLFLVVGTYITYRQTRRRRSQTA